MHRDLASPELWEDSLERSWRRRVLAAQGRKEMARRKQAATAVSAAMVMTQTAPAFAVAAAGGGGPRTKVAQSSPANRAISAGAPAQLLRLGSSGPDVARLQTTLGLDPHGVFGPQTLAAVQRFQQMRGLMVDGIVGPITWQALFGSSATSGASFDGSAAKPRYGFTIQRASKVESAHVRPAIGGKGPVAKIVVRTIPHADAPSPAPHPTQPAVQVHHPESHHVSDVSAPESSPAPSHPQADTSHVAAPPPANVSCGSDRLVAPVKHYVVTGTFGEARPGHMHTGLDM